MNSNRWAQQNDSLADGYIGSWWVDVVGASVDNSVRRRGRTRRACYLGASNGEQHGAARELRGGSPFLRGGSPPPTPS